jgi:alpha-L-arabinofuranosidase
MAIKLWVTLAACVVVAAACSDSRGTPGSAGGRSAGGSAGSEGSSDAGNGGTPASNAGSVTDPTGGSVSEAGGANAGEAGMAATGATGNLDVPATVASDYASYNPVIYYKILSRSSGRALSVAEEDADGSAATLANAAADDRQLWSIRDASHGFKKLINQHSGRALSTQLGRDENGTPAVLWQYLGRAPDQDWDIAPGRKGYVKLGNRRRTAAALSASGNATELQDYASAPEQDWTIVPQQVFEPTVSYRIINKNSGTALSVFQGATVNNSEADIYEFVNQPDQLWHVEDAGGGQFHLKNDKSSRLLSLLGGQTANGTVAMVYDDVGATDQGWAIEALPDGFYRLVNQRRPAGVLSIAGSQTGRETRAQLADDASRRDQAWSFVPVGNDVSVNALEVQASVSAWMSGAGLEDVNHEVYGGIYSQLIFGEGFQEPASQPGVSSMWRSLSTGTASGSFALITDVPFQGQQSQRLTFSAGAGELGIENRGLNRWGIHFKAGGDYAGHAYLRGSAATSITFAAEGADGSVFAEASATLEGAGWQRYDFTLTPSTNSAAGRFALKLKAPGTVDVGYVYLEPGAWGRYHDLPVRKDIADAIVAQHCTVLRYGGSAILAADYRWKNMLGPRPQRPPFKGTWYAQESNGFGIIELLSLAEAAGMLGIPTLNIDEKPADMADFVEYVNGDAATTWGARRVADGHAKPFDIHRIELGNEHLINAAFAKKFDDLAAAIWAKDPSMVLTVGDMSYHHVIGNPDQVTGSEAGLTTLAPYKTILDFAEQHHGKLAIDLHTWTDTPEQVGTEVDAIASFDYWVHGYNPAVSYELNIYELNASHHDVSRALGNALAIGLLEQHGDRVRVVSSANALQADGQNDNGWDQGLVFYDTERSWLQPPGYVTRMLADNFAPTVVASVSSNPYLTVTAKRQSQALLLEVVNSSGSAQAPRIALRGFTPKSTQAQVSVLSGARGDRNDAAQVEQITPQSSSPTVTVTDGSFSYSFAPNSFTVLRLE